MSNGGAVGSGGFIAWFYAVIINRVQKSCKNIFVKISVHIIGLISMIFGLYFFVTTMPSVTSVIGLLLMLIGLVIFVIPFGTRK